MLSGVSEGCTRWLIYICEEGAITFTYDWHWEEGRQG